MSPVAFTCDGADGAKIAAYRWDPAGPPRAILQLTHGMGEHARRYDEVARAFSSAGFAVYGQDHRGHGATAATSDELGMLGPTDGRRSSPTLGCSVRPHAANIRTCR